MLHSEGSLVRGSDGATEVHSLMAKVFKPGQTGVPAKKKQTPWKHFSHLFREVVYPRLPADPGYPAAPGSRGVQRVKIIAIMGCSNLSLLELSDRESITIKKCSSSDPE